jgi:hypothetical protein
MLFKIPIFQSRERPACAVRFARDRASDSGCNPNQITILGSSAGGSSWDLASLAEDKLERGDCGFSYEPAIPNTFVGYENAYEYAITEYDDVFDHTCLQDENPDLLKSIDPHSYLTGNPNLRALSNHGHKAEEDLT